MAAVPAEGFSRGEKFTPFAKFEPNSDGLRLLDTSGKGNFTEALDKVLSKEPSAGTAGQMDTSATTCYSKKPVLMEGHWERPANHSITSDRSIRG